MVKRTTTPKILKILEVFHTFLASKNIVCIGNVEDGRTEGEEVRRRNNYERIGWKRNKKNGEYRS